MGGQAGSKPKGWEGMSWGQKLLHLPDVLTAGPLVGAGSLEEQAQRQMERELREIHENADKP